MNQEDIRRVEGLMGNRDHHLLNTEQFNHHNLLGLADEVPGLLAEVRRLQAENDKMKDALGKVHDLATQMSNLFDDRKDHPNIGAIQDWCHQAIGPCKKVNP